MSDISALVLAAGRSSRMGEFKPLLRFGMHTVIEQAIGCFLAAGIADVRVVVGHRAEEIIPLISPLGVSVIVNHQFESGMFSSVLAGLEGLPPETGAFFLLPGDMPLVKPKTVDRLREAYLRSDVGVIYPVYSGERGHPPLIAARYREALASWDRPGGLQGFLKLKEAEALDLIVEDPGVVMDLDYPEDYQRLQQKLGDSSRPSEPECLVFLKKTGVPKRVVEHARVVSRVALKMATALNQKGHRLDSELVAAAGLLHDLAKGQPHHPQAGARVMRDMGYHEVAEIVGSHQDIIIDRDGPIAEAELVYLADKLVDGVRLVELRERVILTLSKYAREGESFMTVEARLNNAALIMARVEKEAGLAMKNILGEDQ